MMKVLIMEPGYSSKYAPLGLMKIAYYHKIMRGDLVWFSKGSLRYKISPTIRRKIKEDKYYADKYGYNIDEHLDVIENTIKEKSWDRIYITTLFTYEYDAVINTIEEAKSIVDDVNKIYVGGIMATLMSDKLIEDTGVNVISGQLIDSSYIGFDDYVNIDELTPDYSILSNTEYQYNGDSDKKDDSDAYYAYTTKGCGMQCGFCAVQTLEPKFVPYISIKNQIEEIDRLYGPKKNLLLMDNNILKSRYLKEIVDDLVELGFYKGAKYINPKTGRYNKRFIDFNQGLDAKLMTPEKAELLGKLALKPGRVAFDHIEDKDIYMKAIRMLISKGTTNLSNYILYNSDSFFGKGTLYAADGPEDLYERIKINMELQDEANRMSGSKDVQIYSFPMKYTPLDDKSRTYVGPKWNKKFLRAVRVLLNPTMGKVGCSSEYFYNIYGANVDEFLEIIRLPEYYLEKRGIPKNNGDELSYKKKLKDYDDTLYYIEEWKNLYYSFSKVERDNFEDIIGDNDFTVENYKRIQYDSVKQLYVHYMSPNQIVELFEYLDSCGKYNEINMINNYISNNARIIYERLTSHLMKEQSKYKESFNTFVESVFDDRYIIDILDSYESKNFNSEKFDIIISKIISEVDEETLYACMHTWIRNRRLDGLMRFCVDVAKILIEVDKKEDRSMYIKQEMIKIFKAFLREKYPSKYKLSDKYYIYKYDIMVIDSTYDPYIISESMKSYAGCYPDSDSFYDEDIYYDVYDDYECFNDMYDEFERARD